MFKELGKLKRTSKHLGQTFQSSTIQSLKRSRDRNVFKRLRQRLYERRVRKLFLPLIACRTTVIIRKYVASCAHMTFASSRYATARNTRRARYREAIKRGTGRRAHAILVLALDTVTQISFWVFAIIDLSEFPFRLCVLQPLIVTLRSSSWFPLLPCASLKFASLRNLTR